MMKPTVLPPDFDGQIAESVRAFWSGRLASRVTKRQGGARDAVVGGKNMDGFIGLVVAITEHCGLPAHCVNTRKSKVVLPGFFRATKNWDVVVIHERRLIAVFEFKSQVGSFGNNFNNRSEEVIGSAADLWVAHHHGAFSDEPRGGTSRIAEAAPALLNPTLQGDPRPPFLAWLMLLEECEASLAPVRCDEPHFPVFDEFKAASYARRYQVLCERLVERQLYSAAALELTLPNSSTHRALSRATSIRSLFADFSGRLLAAQDR